MPGSTNTKDAFKTVKKQAKDRRYSVVPENDATDIEDAWRISNVAQLQQWSQERPNDVMEMLMDLRYERDQCLHVDIHYDTLSKEKSRVEEERDQLHEEVDRLQTKLSESHDTIRVYKKKYLDAEHAQLNSDEPIKQAGSGQVSPALAPAEVPSATNKTKKSTRMPDPAMFTDGVDPTWQAWSNAILDKLIVNEDHYPTERSKIIYVVNRVGGDAQETVAIRRQPNSSNPYMTVQDVMDDLAESYQDIDRRANARREYDSLTQDPELPFRDFFTKFKRLGGELAINESTLMDDLAKRLSPELNTKFTGVSGLHGNFITLLSMRDYLTKTDNTLRSQELDKRKELVRQALVQKNLAVAISTPSSTQEDLDKDVLCFNCGQPGHRKKSCPSPKYKATEKATEKAAESDSEPSDSDMQ